MRRTAIAVGFVVVVAFVFAGGIVAGEQPVGADSAALATTESEQLAIEKTQDCGYPVEIEDASGQTVTLDEEPDTVVVLGASAAQHMWEIGAQDKVRGMPVNQFTAYLDGSEDRVNVVDQSGQPVQEEVINLEPDLVLAPNIISEDAVQQLRDAGLTVYYSPLMTSVEDMYDEVSRVGQLVGACDGASQTISETRTTIDQIEQAVADEESPTVYYDLGFGWTAGEGTLENQLITKAGGQNIALQADKSAYFEINQEVVLQNDPEWIVAQEGQPLPKNEAINQSTAVQEDQIIRVNPNYISQHGPRIVSPLEKMATAFHPEAMAELEETPTPEPTATATPTPEETPTASDTPTPVEETDTPAPTATPAEATDSPTESADDNGPGFAVVGAIAALVALVLAARYRR